MLAELKNAVNDPNFLECHNKGAIIVDIVELLPDKFYIVLKILTRLH